MRVKTVTVKLTPKGRKTSCRVGTAGGGLFTIPLGYVNNTETLAGLLEKVSAAQTVLEALAEVRRV